MPSIRHLFKSMQFQLIFWSVLALLLLAVIAGGYGFWYSYEKLNEFQDDNLKSMSALLQRTLDIEADNSNQLLDTNLYFETDEDDGSITVDVINKALSAPLTYNLSHKEKKAKHHDDDFDGINVSRLPLIPVGISTQTIDDHIWRVYRSNSANKIIIVRQRTEFQEDLAKSSALQSFFPLIIGMAFLMLLLPFIMWRMLKPVRQLQSEVNLRRESDLNPLSINNLPTELLPLAQSLNRLLALVKISIERQQRFIADAAHELRSPLTAISLQLQRLQRINNDSVMTEGLDKLAIRLKRNQRLVEQLLTLARAGNINMKNNSEQGQVSVKAIIEQVIGLLIPIADNKNIALTVQLLATDQICMDETSLLLLVKNLIQNAIVYTPDNGEVAIKLFYLTHDDEKLSVNNSNQSTLGSHVINSGNAIYTSNEDNNRLALEIMDSGKGIHPDDYINIFEPFVRLSQTPKASDELSENAINGVRSDSAGKKTNAIEGTGLGLSIVKSICEQADIDVFLGQSSLVNTSIDRTVGLCVTLVFAKH